MTIIYHIGIGKKCSKCGTNKAFDEYSPDNRALDGLQSQCKACKGIVNRPYQKARKAKAREIRLQQRALIAPKKCAIDGCSGKLHGRIWCRKHYARNFKHSDPLYGEMPRHEQCIIEGCKEKPRSGYSQYCEVHYYRIRRNGTIELRPKKLFIGRDGRYKTLRSGQRFKPIDIYERDKWSCGICHRKVNRNLKHPNPMSPSLDHIIPIALGGLHERKNVQIAHLSCNRSAKIGGIKQLRMFG